jgi:hypothetical protein
MYCRKCYTKLDPDEQFPRCSKCDASYNPGDPSTYLPRPFPGKRRIIWYIIQTSIISLVAAFVVSFFQMANASGH